MKPRRHEPPANRPFLCSAMDGCATAFSKVLETDLPNPVFLSFDPDVLRVNTGDPLLAGTDAVSMVEDMEKTEGPRGASIYSSPANTDGLIRVPESIEGPDEGESITRYVLKSKGELDERTYLMGSHDLSLGILGDMIKKRFPDCDLVSTHTESMSGIMALGKGITDLVRHLYP